MCMAYPLSVDVYSLPIRCVCAVYLLSIRHSIGHELLLIHTVCTASALPLYFLCTASALPLNCVCTASALPLRCLCLWTAYSRAIHPAYVHCLSTAIRRLFAAYSLTICCPFAVYSLSLFFIFAAYSLLIRCLFAAYSLSIHFLFAASSLLLRCLFAVYLLRIHCLFTASPLPNRCLFGACSLYVRCLFAANSWTIRCLCTGCSLCIRLSLRCVVTAYLLPIPLLLTAYLLSQVVHGTVHYLDVAVALANYNFRSSRLLSPVLFSHLFVASSLSSSHSVSLSWRPSGTLINSIPHYRYRSTIVIIIIMIVVIRIVASLFTGRSSCVFILYSAVLCFLTTVFSLCRHCVLTFYSLCIRRFLFSRRFLTEYSLLPHCLLTEYSFVPYCILAVDTLCAVIVCLPLLVSVFIANCAPFDHSVLCSRYIRWLYPWIRWVYPLIRWVHPSIRWWWPSIDDDTPTTGIWSISSWHTYEWLLAVRVIINQITTNQ